MNSPEASIKSLALAQGFELCGIASLSQTPSSLNRYPEWLAAGYAGEMGYLEKQKEKRLDPALVLPGCKSLIYVGLIYNTAHPYSIERPGEPTVSRYAWGDDYHEVMWAKLRRLEEALRAELGTGFEMRAYADTGPVSEKAWAAAAGLGWVGKNTNLINQEKGSWFFIGELLTTLELSPDQPAADLCGTCTRCLDACPTDAFVAPYQLDATRCISYLTIEKRGDIPAEFHAGIGLNLYGCDICQDVCPWNRLKITGNEPAFQPRPDNLAIDLEKLANIPDEEFSRLYNGSAMKRTKAAGLRRNAKIVKANLDARHGDTKSRA